MCGFGFLTPLHFGLHLSLCKVWGLYNYFLFSPKYIPPLPLPSSLSLKKSFWVIHFTGIWSWEVQDRQTLFCSMHTMFLGTLMLHSQTRTTLNSNNDYDLSFWIGEHQCMQMDFWQFFRNTDICVIPGKSSEIHWHAWLFSNPRERVFFLLKSMGQICPLDLILLRTFPHGLKNNHACKWISDNFPGITHM